MTARARIAALLSVSVVALVALAGCGGSEADDQTPAAGSTHHHDHPGSAGSPGDDPSGSATAPAGTVTVPVYFVGDTPDGKRLFREFRKVDPTDPLDEALSLAASGDALDPDYDTLLPSGSFSGSTHDEGASVQLPSDDWTRLPDGLSESDALLAVQQLVYTAQGVLQQRLPISFVDSDGNATQIFGIASEDGFRAADPIKTLALMSVTSPEQGQHVGDTFTASGVGSSFEANVPWEIRQGGTNGDVVEKGFATADGWMDKLYPWQSDIDVSGLDPGDYTFVAMTDDPSSGEGRGPTQDSKDFTVG